jgi:hypothetical protein
MCRFIAMDGRSMGTTWIAGAEVAKLDIMTLSDETS